MLLKSVVHLPRELKKLKYTVESRVNPLAMGRLYSVLPGGMVARSE
jgi:hypothetical protein